MIPLAALVGAGGIAWAILLNAPVLAAAWRFVRRRTATSPAQNLADTLLLWCAIQYLAVGLTGLLGFMAVAGISIVALAAAAALWLGAGPAPPPQPDQRPDLPVAACAIFAAAFVAAIVYINLYMPVLMDDALTYHVPAAAQWLRDGRLSLFETWGFNPANTYSPLAGSMFIAWLMAPLHNDLLARFVQIPALVMIFALMARLCAALGAGPWLAALAATAAALCRPTLSQAPFAMDDLWVTAFFLAAVVGLGTPCAGDRLAPWRVALAVGLLLATKYTALLTLPMLLLLIDGPRLWPARRWAIAAAFAALLAAPWFLRNWCLTGNPLFPMDVTLAGHKIFTGLLTTRPNPQLHSWNGLSQMLAGRYFSMPPGLLASLAAAWLFALLGSWRRLFREPLLRACLLGPVIGLGLLILQSPFADITRYALPALLLLFGCVVIALRRWVKNEKTTLAAAAALAAAAVATSYVGPVVGALLLLAIPAAAVLFAIYVLGRGRALAIVALLLTAFVWLAWPTYADQCAQQDTIAWNTVYGPLGEAWQAARALPPGKTLAYANTYFVYPLMGFDAARPVVYVPTRAGVKRLCDLPHFSAPVGDQDMDQAIDILRQNTDEQAWLAGLRDRGVDYLFVAKDPPGAVQLVLARRRPDRFHVEFANDAAVIYRVQK